MKITSVLQSLGLHSHEIAIYLAILELGTASMSDITKHTRLHRPTVYKFLPKLIERNLISFTPTGKRKLYYAESPMRLKKVLGEVSTTFEEMLPDLLQMYVHQNTRPKMRFFEGKGVIKWIYDDLLATCKKGDVFYRYESPRNYVQQDNDLPRAYVERICRKKEIQKFVITNEKTAKTKKRVVERISKAIPAAYDLFEYDMTQIIYRDKVAFIDYSTQTGWIIDNPRFATFQRQLFKLLFKKL